MKIKAKQLPEKTNWCYQCGKTIAQEKTTIIRLSMYDSKNRYKHSNRKFIHNLIIRLCQKCQSKVENKLKQIITNG